VSLCEKGCGLPESSLLVGMGFQLLFTTVTEVELSLSAAFPTLEQEDVPEAEVLPM
jgi:hypothetical protein